MVERVLRERSLRFGESVTVHSGRVQDLAWTCLLNLVGGLLDAPVVDRLLRAREADELDECLAASSNRASNPMADLSEVATRAWSESFCESPTDEWTRSPCETRMSLPVRGGQSARKRRHHRRALPACCGPRC